MFKNPKEKEGEVGIFLFTSGSSDTAEILLNRSYKVPTEPQGGAGPETLPESAAQTLVRWDVTTGSQPGLARFLPRFVGTWEAASSNLHVLMKAVAPSQVTPALCVCLSADLTS